MTTQRANSAPNFAAPLLAWFDTHGRHDLPWQQQRSPYRVWLSETMLQQTQVAAVRGYFARFVTRFPTLAALAQAELDEVLAQWAGLGYYSRARNLHRCARLCVAQHQGDLPANFDALLALPGIGRSTAGAILAQAFNQRAAILDGNVRRVLTRQLGIAQWPGLPTVQRQLWQHADALLPALDHAKPARFADYTQAQMDLGALICTPRRPKCGLCPVSASCVALVLGKTAELPARRAKKLRPIRLAHWLIALDESGRVLLLRRPEKGIWGGLYCLPEAQDAQDFHAEFPNAGVLAHVTEVRHEFTHFTLIAQVSRAQMAAGATGVCEQTLDYAQGTSTHIWADAGQRAKLGLPAPIKKLLDGLT